MPKVKRPVAATKDSSDSDSGPDDKNEKSTGPDAKRPKFSDDKDEPCWELEKNRFVKVRVFKGKVGVDIREYYEKDGKLLPGKKGISLNEVQFNKLAEVFDAIKAEVKKH